MKNNEDFISKRKIFFELKKDLSYLKPKDKNFTPYDPEHEFFYRNGFDNCMALVLQRISNIEIKYGFFKRAVRRHRRYGVVMKKDIDKKVLSERKPKCK